MPVVEDFSERIKVMQNSITKAKKLYPDAIIFLIAGSDHLFRTQTVSKLAPLDDFYSFLKPRKVVILTPKSEVINPINEEFQQFYNELIV